MTWLRRIFARKRIHDDLSEEIRAHLDEQIEELVAEGMPRKEAEHAARRQFGNVLQLEERSREIWRWPRLENFLIDLRYALRTLHKSPGFTVVAILTLALGIGANTAIFSMVNGILLRPLPYRQPQRLYQIYETIRVGAHLYPSLPVNAGNYLLWKRECRSFSGIAILMPVNDNLDLRDGAVPVHGAKVSSDFLALLGVRPALGAISLPREDVRGRGRGVILTHSFWSAYFHSDPRIVGKTILLGGYPYAVVGVLRRDFYIPKASQLYTTPFAGLGSSIQFFVPLNLGPNARRPGLGYENYAAIARLRPGVSRATALTDLDAVEAGIVRNDPYAKGATLTANLVPLKSAVTGSATEGLWALLAGAVVVLLIVCVNLAGLLLARGLGRRHEIAVRAALGASRWNLLRQFLAEGLILALAGGGVGLLLAYTGLHALIRMAPISIPRIESVAIDARVLLFTVLVALSAGLLFALLPAFQMGRTLPGEALRASPRTGSETRGAMRLRNVLTVAEIALCSVLLAAAFLLAESLGHVLRANSWLQTPRVVALRMSLPRNQFPDSAHRVPFFGTLIRKIGALPGVSAAGIINALPLQGAKWTDGLEFQEVPQPAGSVALANFRFASPGYFHAVGLPLFQGRFFASSDRGHPVVLISKSVATRVLSGRNPIGLHLQWRDPKSGKPLSCEVVGVVGDARTFADRQAPLTVYFPNWLWSPFNASLVVRSAADPRITATEIRETLRSLDPEVAFRQEGTLTHLVSQAVAPRRFVVNLGTLFALFAAFLAMLGLYGVISLAVAQREQELGLRIALGAEPGRILLLVLGQGSRLAILGVAFGLAGGLGVARLLKSLLYGVTPGDPATYIVVGGLMTAVALLACYVPARRAARVDPMTALRNE